MVRDPNKDRDYSEREADERFEKTLRGALKTSPKPLKDAPKKREKGQERARSADANTDD
jgi:hypothetical protein